jgi:hypothetical protein
VESEIPFTTSNTELDKQFQRAMQTTSTLLVEWTCDGCLQSIYQPVICIPKKGDEQYPDLEEIQDQLRPDKEKRRHIATLLSEKQEQTDQLPSGYAFCGYYVVSRLWMEWENPTRWVGSVGDHEGTQTRGKEKQS